MELTTKRMDYLAPLFAWVYLNLLGMYLATFYSVYNDNIWPFQFVLLVPIFQLIFFILKLFLFENKYDFFSHVINRLTSHLSYFFKIKSQFQYIVSSLSNLVISN